MDKQIFFKFDSDTGSDHIKFTKTCPCGTKFSFTESYMNSLGTCAICKNRFLHCGYEQEIVFHQKVSTIHVCHKCFQN